MRPNRSPARRQNRPKRSPARRRAVRFAAAIYRTAISEKLDTGLSLQRIWQDLVEECGYGGSYESVKRFVRTLAPTRRAVGVFHCAPGCGRASGFLPRRPTLDTATGEWRRPWVFRMTLRPIAARLRGRGVGSETRDVSAPARAGVPRPGRGAQGRSPRQSQGGVVRACFYDPDSHEVYLAFAKHWGFTPLPTQPRRPQENGKQERSGTTSKTTRSKAGASTASRRTTRFCGSGIARSRGCASMAPRGARSGRTSWRSSKGRSNHWPLRPLRCLPAGSARSTPMATSRWLGPSIRCRSRCSASGVRVRWDAHLVRVFHGDALVMVHARVAAGVFAPRAGEAQASTRQRPT